MALRIDAKLGEYARTMRVEPTAPEALLWKRLRASQLEGFKFRRQTVIGPYICDFFCPAKGLILELDGDTHVAEADAERDAFLNAKGFAVLRFSNRDVVENLEGVLEAFLLKVRALPPRFTHPLTPSLEREGER
jgi:very-short-patch-repair endonuclease